MSDHDKEYHKLLEKVYYQGKSKENRTGILTKSIFSYEMRFDLSDGTIPLLTTKRMHYPAIIHELLWFLSGSSDIEYLKKNNVRIWDEWQYNNSVGPLYGTQWRNFNYSGVDQIQEMINTLIKNPDSRRIIVSAWNPEVLPDESISPQENVKNGNQCLAPCHAFFQCYSHGGELSLKLTQRSCDLFLGVPFNIAQYSILLHILAKLTHHKPKEFIWSGGDVHIYENQLVAVEQQLERSTDLPAPKLILGNISNIDHISFDDIKIDDYISYEKLTAKVAV